ncbi:erythromycin esterase family protein [Streptomyces sp. SAJ15]|uniref:erythromycin esterase family protein n=1 Tax=Streptomyces sp. SAJ15 TaxID=2011095 RepID=UPI001185CA91|nr:erythromycin esterase family protein [Streptomyces sp. SAJ15]TVL90569.1 erythromycin esterase [Streptomyces sp. SAJ15]
MRRHRATVLTAALLCLGALGSAGAAPALAESPHTSRAPWAAPTAHGSATAPAPHTDPVTALERAAHPLRSTEPSGPSSDLRPFGRMVGDAKVVGLGEATHGSHEFFAMKHRVFRYLVEQQGFRSFALEAPWSTGLRLNAYVLRGEGDPRRIMREEFQDAYRFWNNDEYLSLLRWMRAYNVAHPKDPVQFMGDDFGYAGPELYDRVTDYVREAHPALLPEFTELYRGLRPTTDVRAYMTAYMAKPLDERREMAARTRRALDLLSARRPGSGPAERARFAWAVRHATALDQTAQQYAFDFADPTGVRDAMLFRDRAMADNTAWWQRQTGDRVLLSAHNAHVSYESYDAGSYPRMQGAFLRDRLGSDYVSVGFTFDRGSFKATDPEGKAISTHTVGPAAPGSNEHTLDRVRHRDYVVDLRSAPPAARAWLATPRPTRAIGTSYPEPDRSLALAPSHDVLIHLREMRAAELLPE